MRLGVKAVQHLGRELNLAALTSYREFLAAPGNGNVQRRFNLANIGVHGTAQRRQPVVVHGRESKFHRRCFHALRRNGWCRHAVIEHNLTAQRVVADTFDDYVDEFPNQAQRIVAAHREIHHAIVVGAPH